MKIAIFSSARSELGLLYWAIRRIKEKYDLKLFLGGGLTSKTYADDEENRYKDIMNEVPYLLDGHTSSHMSKSVGVGIISFSQALQNYNPDILIILGDRYDLFIPVSIATIANIPIIHLCGGDITNGAIDNNIRYAVSKLAHIHIVQTEVAAMNISKSGEEDWRIEIAGGPGVENIYKLNLPSKKQIKEKLNINLKRPTILCTYHPVTLEKEIKIDEQMDNILEAISEFKNIQFVLTYPGAEINSNIIIEKIIKASHKNENIYLFKNLGTYNYLGIMKRSVAVLGNSSSGILEAPSYNIPTINVGRRQEGRERAKSVIDCDYSKGSIVNSIKKALDKSFKENIKNCKNPYDPYRDGNFSGRLINVIENLPNKDRLLQKRIDFEVKSDEWNKLIKR